MRDHLLLIRVRADTTFNPTREALRGAVAAGLEAWPCGVELVSLSPLPADRYIKPRKPPVRRDYPLLSYLEGK